MPVNTANLITLPTLNQAQELGYGVFPMLSTETGGTSVQPAITFGSEVSLGFYRSAASFVALSYGTLVLPSGFSAGGVVVAASGISVGASGNSGSLIPGISSTSSLVAAFVVQGSASSFTWISWPAALRGDQILTTPFGAAVSSVSSGLVPWSHCTVAGQIEFRLSNVSTLAQNQSSITWYFTRITPF